MCVYACACVRGVCFPPLLKTFMQNQASPTAFQCLYMTLAVNVHGLSNEAHHGLLPKKSKVMLYLL